LIDSYKLIRKHTQTHTADRLHYTASEVVGDDNMHA